MKKAYQASTNTINFVFDGGLGPVTLAMDALAPAVREYAAVHGMLQRLGDAAAISKKDAPGGVVTEEMRREAVLELAAHYEGGGAWETGVRRGPVEIPAIRAIAEQRGITYAQAAGDVLAAGLAQLTAGGV